MRRRLRYRRRVPRVLALDFDGVISNSAPEAFVVALRTWVSMKPGTPLARHAAGVVGESAPAVSAVERHALYAGFLALMPLGNRAEDYAVALASLEAGRSLADQGGYDAFRAELDPAWLREYHARFYRERNALSLSDTPGWHALMSPFGEFLDLLRRRARDAGLSIATAKDRGSVRKLLRAYGVDDLFPEDRVLDKEAGVTKTEHLRVLRAAFDCPYGEMTFVDDKVNHLDAVAPLGVRCALATWGFNGPREEKLARAAGHLVCSLADFEEQVFD